MASQQQVKQYLAHWFQLGRKVWLGNGQRLILPQTILVGDRYSAEFESCWQQIISSDSGDCYLEGTEQTIQELLSPSWDIMDCRRCDMPIPAKHMGISPLTCPCHDLPSWPNLELPTPRSPIDSQQRLRSIQERLNNNFSNRS